MELIKKTSLSKTNDVVDTLNYKMLSLQEQNMDVQTRLADYIYRGVSEVDNDLLQLKALKDDTIDTLEVVANPVFSRERSALVTRKTELESLLQETDLRVAELTRNLTQLTERQRDSDTTVPPQPGTSMDTGAGRFARMSAAVTIN